MTELEIREKRADLGNGFRSGVLILTFSAVIVKIIGLIYKIPMLTLLGSEGMGYFNSAYEIYTLFGVVSTAGLPVAMSVLISRARCGREMTAAKTKRGGASGARAEVQTKNVGASGAMTEERIFSASRSLFLAVGVVGSLLMLSLSPLFSLLLGSRKVIYCLAVISPTVLFICIVGVYRGFFQGLGRMRETAISQVIEAVFKLLLGLLLSYVALRRGYSAPVVAAFGVMGLVLGIAASALYLTLSKRAHGRVGSRSCRRGQEGDTTAECVEKDLRRRIYRELLSVAVPIALSSAVMSVTKIIDMTVILRRMQDIGHTAAEAFSVYGGYTTLALPLFSLAPALTGSVALPLVPSLASCVAVGDRDGQVAVVGDALKLAAVLSMPISLGLSLFSREILSLIFAGQESAVALCAPLLSILALSVPLACFITVENAVLQAYSSASLPIISMLAGSCVKLALAYFLIGDRAVNIAGAPISTFFCDLVINVINLCFIARKMPRAVGFSVIAKPFFAAFIAVGGARLALSALAASLGGSSALTLAAIALCALIYLPISLAIGAIGKDDLLSLKRKC